MWLSLLESLAINLNCNEIVSELGYFYFDTKHLQKFKNKFSKLYRKEKTFTSLTEARNYRNSILKEPNLVLTETPDWVNFEGTFSFTYQFTETTKNWFDNEAELLNKLQQEIKLKYPGEIFELSGTGGSTNQLFGEVKCNQSLSDKFTLYTRNIKYDSWKPYDLTCYSFWTVSQ